MVVGGRAKAFANYLWQLRPYSYVDLLLMLEMLHASGREVLAVSLLWFGFLIHLEWRHEDVGRLSWPWWAWVVPWLAAIAVMPNPKSIVFFGFAILYSLKKRIGRISAVSFVVNGLVKGALILPLATATWPVIALVVGVMSLRNLAGDVRDAGKDAAEGVASLPVLIGWRRNTRFIYPICLVTTSVLWTVLGALPWWHLATALVVQVTTYGKTPR